MLVSIKMLEQGFPEFNNDSRWQVKNILNSACTLDLYKGWLVEICMHVAKTMCYTVYKHYHLVVTIAGQDGLDLNIIVRVKGSILAL